MTPNEIIEILNQRKLDYLKTLNFSSNPGIYAFFFIGDKFPIFEVNKHEIIYIGKTESSQIRRDVNTHFGTGKTGSSTVRRSIGALLRESENLIPLPRNSTDYLKARLSHYKFDSESEIIITGWMEKNLALSFYEFPVSPELEEMETELIRSLKPVLNIDKNLDNPFRNQLLQLRKHCSIVAYNNLLEFR